MNDMKEGIAYSGVPSEEELAACPGVPSRARMARGAVAYIECVQCIPCNPCQQACPQGAITVGTPMTNMPVLDENKCVGCGRCVSKCPGLAITVINKACGGGLATLDFPYEYLPLPKVGDTVEAADRLGQAVCPARVLAVRSDGGDEGTRVIRIEFPLDEADRVRTIRRLKPEV